MHLLRYGFVHRLSDSEETYRLPRASHAVPCVTNNILNLPKSIKIYIIPSIQSDTRHPAPGGERRSLYM